MERHTKARLVLSQWRVVVPVMVLTVGLASVMWSSPRLEYEARGFLVLDTPGVDTATAESIDPLQISRAIDLEGDTTGRDFTVSLLDGSNYSVASAAPDSTQSVEDARYVVSRLSSRIANVQDQADVDPSDQVELRRVDPRIVAEEQADGSWLAATVVYLDDPSMAVTNPYLANSSTGRLLQVAFQGDVAQAEFAERTAGQVTIEVGQEARDAAPLLEVLTTGENPEAVIEGFSVARTMMANNLADRQTRADVPSADQITLEVLVAPLEATDESPPAERGAVGVLVLGSLLALGLAFGVEALQRRRDTGDVPLGPTLGEFMTWKARASGRVRQSTLPDEGSPKSAARDDSDTGDGSSPSGGDLSTRERDAVRVQAGTGSVVGNRAGDRRS